MHDLKWLLENPDTVKAALKNRNAALSLDELFGLNDQRKKLQLEYDQGRALQNHKSKEIAALQKQKKDAQNLIKEMQAVARRLKEIGPEQTAVEDRIRQILLTIPNIPHASVPVGSSEEANVVVRTWGERKNFAFKPREHWEIGESLGMLDFERGAKIAGSRFTLYRGALAKMERALIHLMLETHTSRHGYQEVLPPFLVNSESALGTGQLPKFEDDLFKTTNGYYLIPTAEVPVTNIHRGEVLAVQDLPLKYCAYTPCFRSEAGSHGKDVKGLIRQHQFNKVELVKWALPERSYDELESLTRDAEKILQMLDLPYRVVTLCTGDMGFGSAKTYDIEVWLPGQNAYREISSCSNFEAFQARRMNTRYRDQAGKLHFIHTLNGSGLAVGRTLVAVLENYQQQDGGVVVPQALQEFMGLKAIKPSQTSMPASHAAERTGA